MKTLAALAHWCSLHIVGAAVHGRDGGRRACDGPAGLCHGAESRHILIFDAAVTVSRRSLYGVARESWCEGARALGGLPAQAVNAFPSVCVCVCVLFPPLFSCLFLCLQKSYNSSSISVSFSDTYA